jgi:hypothetical protein
LSGVVRHERAGISVQITEFLESKRILPWSSRGSQAAHGQREAAGQVAPLGHPEAERHELHHFVAPEFPAQPSNRALSYKTMHNASIHAFNPSQINGYSFARLQVSG